VTKSIARIQVQIEPVDLCRGSELTLKVGSLRRSRRTV